MPEHTSAGWQAPRKAEIHLKNWRVVVQVVWTEQACQTLYNISSSAGRRCQQMDTNHICGAGLHLVNRVLVTCALLISWLSSTLANCILAIGVWMDCIQVSLIFVGRIMIQNRCISVSYILISCILNSFILMKCISVDYILISCILARLIVVNCILILEQLYLDQMYLSCYILISYILVSCILVGCILISCILVGCILGRRSVWHQQMPRT